MNYHCYLTALLLLERQNNVQRKLIKLQFDEFFSMEVKVLRKINLLFLLILGSCGGGGGGGDSGINLSASTGPVSENLVSLRGNLANFDSFNETRFNLKTDGYFGVVVESNDGSIDIDCALMARAGTEWGFNGTPALRDVNNFEMLDNSYNRWCSIVGQFTAGTTIYLSITAGNGGDTNFTSADYLGEYVFTSDLNNFYGASSFAPYTVQ